MGRVEGHGGNLAVAVAREHGVDAMFTLSGAHVFPLYDGAVHADPPMRLVDVRHEQTAVFAAEAMAKLTRRPGLAALTAGPGVTNGVSAIATAHFNGSPLLVVGGRAPTHRWGTGSLQEIDHPPLVAPITKHAGTIPAVGDIVSGVDDALRVAENPHRGPVFLDVPMDQLYSRAEAELPPPGQQVREEPAPAALAGVGALLADAERPVVVLGSDVWTDGAEEAARRAVEELRVPVVANGMGRGVLPSGHELLVTPARSAAFGRADLVIVVGAPLDFRLGFGEFGGQGDTPKARVAHLVDAPDQVATHVDLDGSAAGDLSLVLGGLVAAHAKHPTRGYDEWLDELHDSAHARADADVELLRSDADPIHPGRIYGELLRLLDDDAVIVGDGGDFVSFAGRWVEPKRPGHWLDPGPYGCLGTGLGYAAAARLAHPQSQVVLLLGDGAAGMSLMDVDTLVRHRLPVVIVCGNNGAWGLEKHPMRFLYGYDVAADLQQGTRYDEVARALGAEGELVTKPGEIGRALRRAFNAGAPYLVNIATDPEAAYPRSTTGI
ncbi:MAG: acetolactate synthase [Streptosporangiaceae bacterium]